MWWNDLKEIKHSLGCLVERLDSLESRMKEFVVSGSAISDRDLLEEFFESEDEDNSLNRMHDKLNHLINNANQEQKVALAIKTMDKFEDYMKNVDKLNAMINEFKGCVSLARAAFAENGEKKRKPKQNPQV